jgi:hypothetical protein
MHNKKNSSKTMQGVIVGFRYATTRWLALSGLSLISFILILKDLSFLRTLVVRFYHRKKQQHTISTHAYMIHTPAMHQHISNKEYQKQTCIGHITRNHFYTRINTLSKSKIFPNSKQALCTKQTSCRHQYESKHSIQHTTR